MPSANPSKSTSDGTSTSCAPDNEGSQLRKVRYMVSKETLRRYAARRSETNTNGTEFDSSDARVGVVAGRKQRKCTLPLRATMCSWEDIQIDLREVGYDGRDWINLAQDRDRWQAYVRAAMNLRDWIRDEFLHLGSLSPLFTLYAMIVEDRRMVWLAAVNMTLTGGPSFLGPAAGFSRDGVVNFPNQHVWTDENSHAVEETRQQHRFSINVWPGVLSDRLRTIRATTEINWGSLSGLSY
ncbi:hypothetical protein ANN_25002 [Periplaneta americana]|uniref:Uncharacterized protein n=1 Tax=Periplaneta americana TaxID=6978 RepID=A0ABQ8S0C3_PERAM|nr:hypothetical protein ANN_25002 [Periplaneta americana]